MTQIIGISGLARSGKDSLGSALVNEFSIRKNRVKSYALADMVKADLREFCLHHYGIDTLSCPSQEKSVIRPLLVAHGCAKRDVTEGKHWVEEIKRQILNDSPDYAIVTDVRFKKGEAEWVKKSGGKIVHVTLRGQNPPNEEERVNDPQVKEIADIKIIWSPFSCPSDSFRVAYDVAEALQGEVVKNLSYVF